MFVPKGPILRPCDVEKLYKYLTMANGKTTILTGAGISTSSGIPDYRSEEVGLYARFNHKPMFYQQFLKNEEARKRYWARNYCAFERTQEVEPNKGHLLLKKWFDKKLYSSMVTQNVDRLHSKAGFCTSQVIELHGALNDVICLNCGGFEQRKNLQDRLKELNNNLSFHINEHLNKIAPDGDIVLPDYLTTNFRVAPCKHCRIGIIKPDVVFFGDSVKPKTRKEASDAVTNSDILFCIGTSLQAYSAFRLILQAKEQNKLVLILNIGETRAEKYADFRISANINETLLATDALIFEENTFL
ncbi:NAD-dependent protein lipoamidase sirtuin-4 [Cichlidogyrus casuarinus]|uniref:NAD-dependent protein lipoamidase sirtuin-4 n=1 Tax=Cichlidogyrus casuarinus TaxID=1844966 RepID=A0ABD2Q6S5_9PLAT